MMNQTMKETLFHKEIDGYIQDLVGAIAQHQGIQFHSLKEATNHTEKATQEMRQLFQQSNTLVIQGLKQLSEKTLGFVSEVSKKLLNQFKYFDELAKTIKFDIQENPQALQLFSEAVNSFYDCGDYELEESVLSVFLMLFPLFPQPYACYATLLWRKEGIATAQSFYEPLVEAIEDPILDYFAADCFLKNGHPQKAKKLLQRALNQTKNLSTEHQDLRQHILQLLRECR